MIKVVIDTNVFVGALQKQDAINRLILDMAFRRQINPLMGEVLYQEYHALLRRPGLFEDCVLNEHERSELLDALCSVCEWTEIYYKWRPNLRDEADNHVVELGLAGNAPYVLTWNKRDFNGGELMLPDLKILTPLEFLKERTAIFNTKK
jgi:uncharacterized protein